MSDKKNQIVKKGNNSYPLSVNIGKIEDSIINKTNCKFCQSKHRLEAEKEFDKFSNFKAAEKVFINYGEEISYPAIRNHLINHYMVFEKNVKIKEYGEQLFGWVDENRNRRAAMLERIAMMEKEMISIASETAGCRLDEQRKSADAVKKLCDTITAMEEKIAEIDNSMEPVEIVVTKLSDIISIEIKNASNNEVKRALTDILKKLAESVKDLYI